MLNQSTKNTALSGVDTPLVAGWREWVALPELGVNRIKAKLDSGARTSCIHATRYETFTRLGQTWLRFAVQAEQNDEAMLLCEAPLLDYRVVRDSGGHEELRPVIRTDVVMGDRRWPIDVTVSDRSAMKFRFLLGRSAMAGRLNIQPECGYLLSLEA